MIDKKNQESMLPSQLSEIWMALNQVQFDAEKGTIQEKQ